MSTATKTNPVEEAEQRRAAYSRAQEEQRRLSGEVKSKSDRYRELVDERNRYVRDDPTLIDHTGAPVDINNAVGAVDKEVEGLGSIDDLIQRWRHAEKLTEKAKQDLLDLYHENYDELADALRPKAEAHRDAVREKAGEMIEFLQGYLALHAEGVALTEPFRDLHGGHVPGINEAAGLIRQLETFDLPIPVAEKPKHG